MTNDKQKFLLLGETIKGNLKSSDLLEFGDGNGTYETQPIEITIEYSDCGIPLYKTTFDFNPEEDLELFEYRFRELLEESEEFKDLEHRIKDITSFENRVAVLVNRR